MVHVPVLLHPILEYLLPAARVIDGTLGAGGHTRALLEGGAGAVLAFDLDPQAIALARANLIDYPDRAHICHANYLTMREAMRELSWSGVDAILLDLGVSSMQFDTPERGFSFRYNAPLDMRFNPSGDGLTAAELINTCDEEELADLFFRYGEERDSRRIARMIARERPFHTTRELADAIERGAPRQHEQTIHPATRVFQALRIAVNDELRVVENAIPLAIACLNAGGRLAVISFHSLEDRIVKNAFKRASTDCICPPRVPVCVCGHSASVRLITRKPITANADEVATNPRSRSAKLRIVEKL